MFWLFDIIFETFRICLDRILSSISIYRFLTVSDHKPSTLCRKEVFLRLCQCTNMSQFMQMQCLPWLQFHHYCISLKEAVVPEVLQIAEDYVVLMKSNQHLSQRFPQAAPWLQLKTTALISKCGFTIYSVWECEGACAHVSCLTWWSVWISAYIVSNRSVWETLGFLACLSKKTWPQTTKNTRKLWLYTFDMKYFFDSSFRCVPQYHEQVCVIRLLTGVISLPLKRILQYGKVAPGNIPIIFTMTGVIKQ